MRRCSSARLIAGTLTSLAGMRRLALGTLAHASGRFETTKENHEEEARTNQAGEAETTKPAQRWRPAAREMNASWHPKNRPRTGRSLTVIGWTNCLRNAVTKSGCVRVVFGYSQHSRQRRNGSRLLQWATPS
jgi:hypothetical protein